MRSAARRKASRLYQFRSLLAFRLGKLRFLMSRHPDFLDIPAMDAGFEAPPPPVKAGEERLKALSQVCRQLLHGSHPD